MTAKFEYKVQTILYNRDHAAVEAALNAAGAEGWRVLDLRWQVSSHDFVFITFEREVPRDPDPAKKEAETGAVDATLNEA